MGSPGQGSGVFSSVRPQQQQLLGCSPEAPPDAVQRSEEKGWHMRACNRVKSVNVWVRALSVDREMATMNRPNTWPPPFEQNTEIANVFVRVKISISGVREFPYAIFEAYRRLPSFSHT